MTAVHVSLRWVVRSLPFLLLGLAAAPAAATSYMRMEDDALLEHAAVVAEVRVEATEPTPAGRTPGIDYQVSVEHLIKGQPAGSSLIVRVPGGLGADGLRLVVWGAPEFLPGDRALLFLVEHADGTYRVLQLLLGAFHTLETDGRRIALRDLGGATEVRRRHDGSLASGAGEDRPRNLERFTSWLEDRLRGAARPADYFVDLPPAARRALSEKFTLFKGRNGYKFRWFEFDIGVGIPFFAHSSGQGGVPGGGFDEFQRALAAWPNQSGTPIHYAYQGTTTATAGLKTYDSVNTILFGDPNKEIGGNFDCAKGGILAVGSPWVRESQLDFFQNEIFSHIVGADIITTAGLDCFFGRFSDPSKAAEELFGHELGHTLGLGHACGDPASPSCSDPVKNDALMRAFFHGDGRGARLGADDLAGIRYLYSSARRAVVACRPSATNLCLSNRRFKVELFWRNQFDNSTGLGRAVEATDAAGYFSFGDPNNLEILVKVLDFGSFFKVFYGELTNLNFTLTVTDTATGVLKTYTNTTGDCGGIDQDFFFSGGALSSQTGGESGFDALALASKRGGGSGGCRPDRTTLCLLNGRFAVTVNWSNEGNGTSGQGGADGLSDIVGTFFFSDRNNVELITKVVPFPDRIVFFYGALTDLAYTIHVQDLQTGAVKTYQSTPGKLCGGLDNHAF